MKELLGFVVLTGPLFLIVVWVPISIALAWWVSKKFIKKKPAIKIGGGIAVFLVVLFLPVSDEIAGRIYFNHLCETEAGVKVYQTIELPAEYWDEDGKPKFYGNWDSRLGKKYPLIYTHGYVSRFFYIENAGYELVDKQSNLVLGEVINYRHWGGWIRRNFTTDRSANSCALNANIINRVFVPTKDRM